MKNVLIAAFLFLLTVFGLYLIWYIARGKHVAEKKAQESREKEKQGKARPKARKTASVAGRDSYCYPKINDIMGYEFVKVVNVPADLVGPVNNEPEPAPKEKTWGDTAGIGMTKRSVSAVNGDELRRARRQAEGNDSTGIPDEEHMEPAARREPERTKHVQHSGPQGTEKEMEIEQEEPETPSESEISELPINVDDFEAMAMFQNNDPYPVNDVFNEKDIDNVLDANSAIVDEAVWNEDSEAAKKERDALAEMAKFEQRQIEYDANEGADFAFNIINNEQTEEE